jgi:hypothetical protein
MRNIGTNVSKKKEGRTHLDLLLLGDLEVDGEVDELRVALDEGAELVLLEELSGILLDLHGDLGTTGEGVATGVLGHGEGSVSLADPDVLVVIVVLGGDGDTVSDEVDRVETNTELSDEVHVALLGHLLQEGRSSRLGDGTHCIIMRRTSQHHKYCTCARAQQTGENFWCNVCDTRCES